MAFHIFLMVNKTFNNELIQPTRLVCDSKPDISADTFGVFSPAGKVLRFCFF